MLIYESQGPDLHRFWEQNMKAGSLLLLVALLALGNQPVALGKRKMVKMGACPPDDGPCLSVPDQCLDDYQCPSTTKCCSKTCYLQCVPRISVKPGACPKDLLRCISPIKHLCKGDSDCSGSKRCCLTACGRDCRSPVKG